MSKEETVAIIATAEIDYHKLAEWALGGDTGASSQTIAQHLIGAAYVRGSWPHDLDDFGRCYRLLERVPGLREHFGEMRSLSPVWAALVDAWQEISESYGQASVAIQAYRGKGVYPVFYTFGWAPLRTADEARRYIDGGEWREIMLLFRKAARRLEEARALSGDTSASPERLDNYWREEDRKAEALARGEPIADAVEEEDDDDFDEWEDDDGL